MQTKATTPMPTPPLLLIAALALCAPAFPAAAAEKPPEVPIAKLPVSKPYTGPLAKYDPDRELGLGEAVPEHPDKPLRRYLYANMKDSSERTYSQKTGGIIVLDLDDGLRPVKRITSPLLRGGSRSGNSLGGVRWQAGSAVTDRLYYGYKTPGPKFQDGFNAATPRPDKANAIIGCIDLRTDETLWEQPLEGFVAMAVSPDGQRVYVVPDWQWRAARMAVLDGQTGRVLEVIDTGVKVSHGLHLGRSGRWLYGGFDGLVYDLEERRAYGRLDFLKMRGVTFPAGMQSKALGATLHQIYANGREDLYWSGGKFYPINGSFTRTPPAGILLGNTPSPLRTNRDRGGPGCYGNVLHPGEGWIYSGPARGDFRVLVYDLGSWPPKVVGVMGPGLSSRPQPDPVTGGNVACGNKGGSFISADGSQLWTSDSWYFDPRTWKPLGMMRDEQGKVIRCTKMNEVHFRGDDCVYVSQRWSYGRYREPEKIFLPPTDKVPPGSIADLAGAVGAPYARWYRGAVVADVTLSWKAAADDEGVQRYAVYRDGDLLGNCLGVNPGIDPVLSEADQAEYDKQAGEFQPNTFVARYLAPGKTYRFEIEPIDFAQNRGPRTAIQVAVPAVEDTAAERMVRAWAEVVIAKAQENKRVRVGGSVSALVDGLVPWVHRPWARTVLTQVRKLPKKRVDWKVRAKVTTLLGDTKE